MSGWTDFPLSALGRRQNEALRRRMASLSPAAARYASPLQRARETAEALAGLALGPLRLVSELRELCCGDMDGLLVSETRRLWPEHWAVHDSQRDEGFRWPGGESYREHRDRCLLAIERIVAAHPGERVVVVTHCGVISQVLGAMHGLGPESLNSWRPGNCSLTEVRWGKDGASLVVFDDRSHLEGIEDSLLLFSAARV